MCIRYIVYLTKIAKIHIFQHLPIWPEVAGIMIFHQKWVLWVYLKLSETILHYKSAFHGDFHVFEKNRFFKFKIRPKKWKSQILQRIRAWIKWLFCSKILPYSPPWKVHSHLYFPHICLALNFLKILQKRYFLSFFNIKLNFHFYFLKLFSIKSMYCGLSNAFSNVFLS